MEDLVKIPFDIETAKKVQSEEVPGIIGTRAGEKARIIEWNINGDYPIVAIVSHDKAHDYAIQYDAKGRKVRDFEERYVDAWEDLFLYVYFNDGDVLYVKFGSGTEYVFVYKSGKGNTFAYCSVCLSDKFLYAESFVCHEDDIVQLRYATESEKNVLIEALKKSDTVAAKDYLKRFFNIYPERKFKPFDKVLVRNTDDQRWCISFFAYYLNHADLKFCCLSGGYWKQCVKYEGNEHLLGTTDNPE